MPATDRVLQVGNANFASPVPSATKFTQKKISAGRSCRRRRRPMSLPRSGSNQSRVGAAADADARRVGAADQLAARRELLRHASGAVREASPGVASARVASARRPRRRCPAARSPTRRRGAHARLARRGGAGGAAHAAKVQAVLISGVEVVSHLDEKPFALYQLVAPLLGRARRLPPVLEFVRLDRTLRAAWGLPTHRALCSGGAGSCALPPKTAFWQDATSTAVTSHGGRDAALARRRPRPPVARRLQREDVGRLPPVPRGAVVGGACACVRMLLVHEKFGLVDLAVGLAAAAAASSSAAASSPPRGGSGCSAGGCGCCAACAAASDAARDASLSASAAASFSSLSRSTATAAAASVSGSAAVSALSPIADASVSQLLGAAVAALTNQPVPSRPLGAATAASRAARPSSARAAAPRRSTSTKSAC